MIVRTVSTQASQAAQSGRMNSLLSTGYIVSNPKCPAEQFVVKEGRINSLLNISALMMQEVLIKGLGTVPLILV